MRLPTRVDVKGLKEVSSCQQLDGDNDQYIIFDGGPQLSNIQNSGIVIATWSSK
jgi:hypothetical protein